jgi:hypothetical protein
MFSVRNSRRPRRVVMVVAGAPETAPRPGAEPEARPPARPRARLVARPRARRSGPRKRLVPRRSAGCGAAKNLRSPCHPEAGS